MSVHDTLNAFDRAVLAVHNDKMRKAIIDVMDTALVAKQWFDVYKVSATAADILTATTLILEREDRADPLP
jgi:hypothetical protein